MANDTDRLLHALCYILWPVALVLLIIELDQKNKGNPERRYHAYNGLGFFVALVIVWAALAILAFIPFLGWVVWTVGWIAMLVVAIYFAVQAYQGKRVNIPFVTDFLKKNVKAFK
jgi:uncharacterized membrane protein